MLYFMGEGIQWWLANLRAARGGRHIHTQATPLFLGGKYVVLFVGTILGRWDSQRSQIEWNTRRIVERDQDIFGQENSVNSTKKTKTNKKRIKTKQKTNQNKKQTKTNKKKQMKTN